MIPQFEVDLPAPIPGAGRTTREGLIIAVPTGVISASVKIFNADCILAGWQFRESTGLGGAIAELYDGGDAGGVFLGTLSLQGGADVTTSQSPQAATQSGGNAQQVATITPGAGIFAFITALRIDGLGATAAAVVNATLTGVQGGTRTYPVNVPLGVTVPVTPVTDSFGTRGLQSSAVATPISLTVPAFGAGNTLEEAEINGYFQNAIAYADRSWFGANGIYLRSGLFLNVISGSLKGTFFIRE